MDYCCGPTWGFMTPSLLNDLMTLIQQAFSHIGFYTCTSTAQHNIVVCIIEENININIWKVINCKTGTEWAYLQKISMLTLCPGLCQVGKVINTFQWLFLPLCFSQKDPEYSRTGDIFLLLLLLLNFNILPINFLC